MLCKTYCFAFQKWLFCTVKAYVLQRKRAAFAMPNRNYCFFFRIIFTKSRRFLGFVIEFLGILVFLDFIDELAVFLVLGA